MKRLWRYLDGHRLPAFLLVLVATGNAACQTGGWLLVRDAIDKGIRVGDEHYLTIIVAIYLGVAAAGWVLQAVLIRGPNGHDQSVERAARMSTVAPRQLISVLLVEALGLVPRVPAALAFVNKRRALGGNRGFQGRAGVGRRGARAGAGTMPTGDRSNDKDGNTRSSQWHR